MTKEEVKAKQDEMLKRILLPDLRRETQERCKHHNSYESVFGTWFYCDDCGESWKKEK